MITAGWPQQGQYVDLKEKDISWQVGYVLLRNEHTLKLRFEGWQQKYDEIVHLPDDISFARNTKIQPFRTITRGYSGPQKHPGTRQHWKFTLEQHQHRLKKAEDFIVNLRQKTPEELIQFIRGEHYFYINFLMANTYLLQEDISQVYTYFDKHIVLAKNYLQYIAAKGISWIQLNSNTMSEELDKWQRTYIDCYYEIVDSLFLISGLSERLSSFLKGNEKIIKNIVGICETHHNYVAEKFAQLGLVASARRLIKATQAMLTSSTPIKLPFPFVYCLIQLYMTIQRSYLLQKDMGTLQQIKEELFVSNIIQAQFKELEPEDLKNDIHIDRQIQFVLGHIRGIFLMSTRRALKNDWMDTIKIKVNILLIRCDKLERKLKGINNLKEYCETSMREQDDWNEARLLWHSILTKFKCFQLLFLENEHPEIFRRAIQLCQTLYKYNIIGIQDIRYIWTNSIKKSPIFVKILHQFWQDISYYIAVSDIPAFIQIVQTSSQEPNQTNEQIQFFFEFMHVLGKNLTSLKVRQQRYLEVYERSLSDLIRRSIVKIREYQNCENIQMLIQCLSKSIVNYSNYLKISFQLYEQLRSKDSYRMALNILQQIYFHSDSVIYYPPDYFQILFQCLKREDVTSKEVTSIIKLINDIMAMNAKEKIEEGFFKHENMKLLWHHFNHSPDEFKGFFYDWILSTKRYDGLDPYYYINTAFSTELKKYIFYNIILSKEFINLNNISKREAEIIVQFIMFINMNKQKIEKKNYYNNYKVIYRLKQVEVIGEELLWQLFQKSHTHELIYYINRYIIIFNFHYTPMVSFELRKQKIARFMHRIIENIKYTQAKNINLFKPSLNLLRRVLDFIREDRREFLELNSSRVKLQISYNNITYSLDVNIEEKISSIRARIKNLLKLKDYNFKLYIGKGEELSFDHYDLSLCILPDRFFRVVEVLPQEQTIPKMVTSFFDEQLESSLLKMLQNKNICQDVFNFIIDMEFKLNKHAILEIFKVSLDNIFFESDKLTKQTLCYFMLQIKIYNKLLDENVDLTTYLKDDQFKKLLSIMSNPIETHHHITNLTKLCSLILKIYKKNQIIPSIVHLPERCMQTMNEICKLLIRSEQPYSKEVGVHEIIYKIFVNCNSFIEHTIGEKKMLQFYASQKCFQSIFISLYTEYEMGDLRIYMSQRLKSYLTFLDQQTTENYTQVTMARLFFDEVFIKLLINFDNEDKVKNSKGVLEFFVLMALLISRISNQLYAEFVVKIKYNGKSFFEIVLQYLGSLKKKEGHESYWQNYLCGNFILLTNIFKRSPQLICKKIIDLMFIDCLALTNVTVDQPLCRKPSALSACFQLIDQILKNNTSAEISTYVIDSLIPSHKITIWRNISQWSVAIRNQGKQKYRGLINLGCICYMNSLLQQLYAIDQFRLAIVGMPTEQAQQKLQNDESQGKSESQNSHNEFSIIQAMKQLFLCLQYSQENVINPLNFARTIRSNDKKPMIKINEQMDIDEFESILFDRLEHGISSIGQNNFIKELFGGVYAHQIISKECPHTSQREEEFISISLEVKRHIQDCFKSLVNIQTLQGENKYFCEKCDRKVKAQKMQTIKKLPPYLILSLKRFQFNFQIDAKIKINEYCEFTHKLNLKQYSQQEIIKKSKQHLMEQVQKEEQKIPDSYFDYKLSGVVVHSGSADSGHYYSFIENKQGEWYEFNDEEVTPFNLSKLPEEAFGSKDTYEQVRNKNAYLLIYQRVAQTHQDLKKKQKQIISMPENDRIIHQIRKKNRDIHKFELLFSKEYEGLVNRIMLDLNRINISVDIPWYQYLASYFLLIKVRKQNLVSTIQYSKKIERTIETNPAFCKIFLFAFLSSYIMQEFFIFNPIRQKSKILASLFFTSLKYYYISIKHVKNYKSDKIIEYTLQNLKLFFIVNTPVAELTIHLRKFIEFLIEQRDFEFIRHIGENYFFERIMMDYIFPFHINKKYKQDNMIKYNNNRSSIKYKIDYISHVNLEGKPFYPIAISECWKLIANLLKIPYPALINDNYSSSHSSLDSIDVEEPNNNNQDAAKIRQDYFQSMKRQIDALASNKISNYINDTGNYRGVYSMYVVFKELGLIHKLLDSIEHGLRDLQSTKYRGFLMLIDIIVNDPETSEAEIEKILTGLQKNHKHNDRYFLQIDLMHQWIVKYATQSELFLEVLQQRREFIETMIDWINKLPAPTSQIIKKHKSPQNERLLHRYFGITVSAETRDYEVSSARIKKQLQSILKMKLKQTLWNPPLSEDFSVGQTIEFFDPVFFEWKKAKVLQNNFGQILLQREKSQNKFYLWDDSQRLRKATDRNDLHIITEKNSDISFQESEKQNTDK